MRKSEAFDLNSKWRRILRFDLVTSLKATSHSTIFDISMRPLREDQTATLCYPLKKVHNSRDGNYSFEFRSLHAAHT